MTNLQPRHAKLLAAGELNPTEMNAGCSEAIMKPSEYYSVGFAKWNVLSAVSLLCVRRREAMK